MTSKASIVARLAEAQSILEQSRALLESLPAEDDGFGVEQFEMLLPREVRMGNMHPASVLYRAEFFVQYLTDLTGKRWTLPRLKRLATLYKWRAPDGTPLMPVYYQKVLLRQNIVVEVQAYTLAALKFICDDVERAWALSGGTHDEVAARG